MSLTNSENLRDEIDILFRQYVDAIKIRTKCNLNDSAINGESFFRNFLNLIYGFNLSKDRIDSPYNETIDLHDIDKKICVQVTARNDKAKVDITVEQFINKEKYKQYRELHFIIIDREKSFNYDENKLLEYEVKILFHDYTTIFRRLILDFDTYEKIKPIYDFVKAELVSGGEHLETKSVNNPEFQINIYDKIKSLHIVEQIYEVIKIFKGFNCIYPRTIAKLFPFNLGDRIYDAYSFHCLKTNNKSLHEILQKIKVNNYVLTIEDKSLAPFENKLKEIFIILNQSRINCICYREEYTEIEHHNINISPPDFDNGDSYFWRYYKFNLKPLFASLKAKSVQPAENIDDALREGYYFCKIGEAIEGWKIFNKIVFKSLPKQLNPVTEFLTFYNITKIRSFIDLPWWESERKEIIPKIDAIDLHIILSNLTIPVILRNELIRIKENYYLYYSREKIDEYYTRALDLKNLYSKGGNSSGFPSWDLISEELSILHMFYTSNHIVADDFGIFKTVIGKGIEGLIISYSTDDRYEHKYKCFDVGVILLMIFYIGDEQLKKIFEDNGIKTLKIDIKQKENLLKILENYFCFQYTKGPWDHFEFNEDISKQNYFSHFRQELRKIFNRVMLILSTIELTDDELSPLAEPITNF
ncbi:MAG: SMEK domain-containing protein [Saprospiraceae bacterium]|nr:SMEK domain-containing protein [Saprospiraceae bacterium]